MKKVITKDGSMTFFNEQFQEHYHSITGAIEEAREKYAVPAIAFLKEKFNKKEIEKINILDFCFGLGYNSIVFVDELRKKNINCSVKIIGIDNDIEIITEGRKILTKLIDERIYADEKVELKVEIGDASEVIKEIESKFDICFFDPFSPKKCPQLWTEEVFNDIFKLMKKSGILLTYSCARQVRDNMKKAGFSVKDGPSVGRRGPSTLAIKN